MDARAHVLKEIMLVVKVKGKMYGDLRDSVKLPSEPKGQCRATSLPSQKGNARRKPNKKSNEK